MYFYAPEHTLLYKARNLAIEKSKGEFLTFLDVDDLWNPKKIELQIKAINENDVQLIYTNYKIFNQFTRKKKMAGMV